MEVILRVFVRARKFISKIIIFQIHTINLVGNMSKDSIAARLDYANKTLPKILDSAEKPLTVSNKTTNLSFKTSVYFFFFIN